MRILGFFLGLFCFLNSSYSTEHPFPGDENSLTYRPKKRKLENPNDAFDKETLALQIGLLARKFRESLEDKTVLELAHPSLKLKKHKTVKKSYSEVARQINELEDGLSLKRNEVTECQEQLEIIQDILNAGCDETHESVVSIVNVYQKKSFQEFSTYIGEIKKEIGRQENLTNYLKKIKSQKAPSLDEQVTRENLVKFMKKEDRTFGELINSHSDLINTLLDDLGF